MIEQAKFTYSPVRKAMEKQTKTIEDQGIKQVEALKALKHNAQQLAIKDVVPKDQLYQEAKNEIDKIKEIEKSRG